MSQAEFVLSRNVIIVLAVLHLQLGGRIVGKMNWAQESADWARTRDYVRHPLAFYRAIERVPVGAISVERHGKSLGFRLESLGEALLFGRRPIWLLHEGRAYLGPGSIGFPELEPETAR